MKLLWSYFKQLPVHTKDGLLLEINELVINAFGNKVTSFELVRWDQFSIYEYDIPITYLSPSDSGESLIVNLRSSELEVFKNEYLFPSGADTSSFEPAYAEFVDFTIPYLFENSELKFKYHHILDVTIEFLDKNVGTITDLFLNPSNFELYYQIKIENNLMKKNLWLLNSSKIESIDWLKKRGVANTYVLDLETSPKRSNTYILKSKFKNLVRQLTIN